MTVEEIKEELCYYDTRNPDNVAIYGMTEQEIKEDGRPYPVIRDRMCCGRKNYFACTKTKTNWSGALFVEPE